MIAGIFLAAWALQALATGSGTAAATALRQVRVPIILYLGALGWALVQWSSLTPSFMHHPIWAEAASVLGNDTAIDLAGRITVDPGATLTGVMRLASYGALFLLAFLLGRSAHRAGLLLWAIALAATLYAFYGLLNHPMLGGHLGLDFDPEEAAKWNFAGPFGNRNNYATFLGMGLICLLALLLRAVRTAIAVRGWHRRLGRLLGKCFPLLLAVATVGFALVLTASRAGIAATGLGTAVLFAAWLYAGGIGRLAATSVVALAAVLGVGLFALGGDRIAERIEGVAERVADGDGAAEATLGTRFSLYALTWRASGAYPTGTGLGTFADVFPHHRDASLVSDRHYDLAHNSWLENLLELGWFAAPALFLAVAWCLSPCLNRLASATPAIYPIIGLAGTTLVASHGLLDFSLQVPAVAATYAVLLGACTAQSLPPGEIAQRQSVTSV